MATPECSTIQSVCTNPGISTLRTENEDGRAVEVSKVPFPLTLRAGNSGGTMLPAPTETYYEGLAYPWHSDGRLVPSFRGRRGDRHFHHQGGEGGGFWI